jgi:hypothetical protein
MNLVCRRDEVNIMTACSLKAKHGIGKILNSNGQAPAEVTYIVVLAEYTSKVAVRQENGS